MFTSNYFSYFRRNIFFFKQCIHLYADSDGLMIDSNAKVYVDTDACLWRGIIAQRASILSGLAAPHMLCILFCSVLQLLRWRMTPLSALCVRCKHGQKDGHFQLGCSHHDYKCPSLVCCDRGGWCETPKAVCQSCADFLAPIETWTPILSSGS